MSNVLPYNHRFIGLNVYPGNAVSRLQHQLRGPTLSTRQLKLQSACRRRSARYRARVVALVNIDLSPALVLGVGMMGSGLALYTVRSNRPEISRDSDVFFSSIAILVGGILVFQLLTSGTALAFAMEVLNLRNEKLTEMKELPDNRPSQQSMDYEYEPEREPRWIDRLPPPDEQRSYPQRDADVSAAQQPDQFARAWQQPSWESQQKSVGQRQRLDDDSWQQSSAAYSSREDENAYYDRGASSPEDSTQIQQQGRSGSDRYNRDRSSGDNRSSRQTWGGIDDVEDW